MKYLLTEQTLWQTLANAVYSNIISDSSPIDFELGCNTKSLNKYKNLKTLYDKLVESDLISQGDTIVQIRGSKQRLYVTSDGETYDTYKVSTALKGFSNTEDTAKTPLGLCKITKITTTSDKYEVLIGGSETGTILGPNTPGERKNHSCAEVTTGMLVLSGVETCNKNVSNRSIYIHGTNREKYLGTKASGGCVRISNDDILTLTNVLSRGTYVYITNF